MNEEIDGMENPQVDQRDPVVEIGRDGRTGLRLFAVHQDWSITEDERIEASRVESEELLQLPTVSADSFFKALEEHKTDKTKILFLESAGKIKAVLDYSHKALRGRKREWISLDLTLRDVYDEVLNASRNWMTPKDLSNLLMRLRTFSPIDLDFIMSLNGIKVNQTTKIDEYDMNKGYSLAWSVEGKNPQSGYTEIPSTFDFSVAPYQCIGTVISIHARLEVTIDNNGKPRFTIHRDRIDEEKEKFRLDLLSDLNAMAEEYNCQGIPLYFVR